MRPGRKKVMTLAELSPGAQNAIQQRRVAGVDSFKNWQKLLAELAAFDYQTDTLQSKERKRRGIFIVLTIVWGFLGFFLMLILVDLKGVWGPVLIGAGGIIFILFIMLAVVHSRRSSRLGKINLSNDFRVCLLPFLNDLAEDVEPKTKVELELDLAGLTDKKILAQRELPFPQRRSGKIAETVYQDPWCRLSLKLLDGNIITFDLKNYVVRQKRMWRNPRGKFKSKTKWRKTAIAVAGLLPDITDTEWEETRLSELAQREKLKLREKKGGRFCRLVRKWKIKTVNADPVEGIPPHELMGMLMQLYSLLSPAAKGADHV